MAELSWFQASYLRAGLYNLLLTLETNLLMSLPDPPPRSQDEVRRVAKLARLHLDEEQIGELAAQFQQILEAFQTIREVDVEGIAPLIHPGELRDVTRPDVAVNAEITDRLLENAPESRDGYYEVPPTLGEGSSAVS